MEKLKETGAGEASRGARREGGASTAKDRLAPRAKETKPSAEIAKESDARGTSRGARREGGASTAMDRLAPRVKETKSSAEIAKIDRVRRSDVSGNSVEQQERPYAHLKDGPKVGPGKEFTRNQSEIIYDENKRRNGGILKSDRSGIDLVEPKQSRKGEKPPANEAQIDHIVPRFKGGENSFANAQVLSRKENRDKWNK